MADIIFHNGISNMSPDWGAPEFFETFNNEWPYMPNPSAASNPAAYVKNIDVYLNNQDSEYPVGSTFLVKGVYQWIIRNSDLVSRSFDTGVIQFMALEGMYNNGGTVEPCYLIGGVDITSHTTTGQNSYSGTTYYLLAKTYSLSEALADSTKIIETLGTAGTSFSSLSTNSSRQLAKFGLTFLNMKYDANRQPMEYSTPWFMVDCLFTWANPANSATDKESADLTLDLNASGRGTVQDNRHMVIRLENLLMFTEWNDTIFTIEERSEEVGEPSEPGGYGGGSHAFDRNSDSIAVPSVPQIGALATGFIHAYSPELSDLSGLGSELLPQLTFPQPSPISAGSSVMETLADMFDSAATWLANVPSIIENSQRARMIDYVLDCHLIPVTPNTGSAQAIRVGWQTLQSTAKVCTSDYVYKSLGEISLYEFYENFADYLAHGRLFIPFVGFVGVQPEWFNNTALSIEYLFNIIDGSFTAYLSGRPISDKHTHLRSKVILGQWGGSCCVHIPITGINYASMMSGAIGGAAGAIQSAGTGNLAGAATGAISAMSARAGVEQSNSYSASAAFMGGREAYIMMERPVSSWSKTYQHEIGIPSNISATLGDLSGFAKVENIHLDGVSATEAEKTEIEALLRQGVIF